MRQALFFSLAIFLATIPAEAKHHPIDDKSLKIRTSELPEVNSFEDLDEIERIDRYFDEWWKKNPQLRPKADKYSRLVIRVEKKTQRMTVYGDNEVVYSDWKVSTGDKSRGITPSGRFSGIFEMNRRYFSRRFGVVLPQGLKFYKGYLIHAASKGGIPHLGKARSHGCIRLHPAHAKALYDLVEKVGPKNTTVFIR